MRNFWLLKIEMVSFFKNFSKILQEFLFREKEFCYKKTPKTLKLTDLDQLSSSFHNRLDIIKIKNHTIY